MPSQVIPTTNDKQVFISYAHADREWVKRHLKKRLTTFGFSPWLDEVRLRAGENWTEKIDEAINQSFAVIVVMTPDSFASKYVTYEWAYALGNGVKVVPILLKASEKHPRLQNTQYLDFTDGFNAPWIGLRDLLVNAEKERPSTGAALVALGLLREGLRLRDTQKDLPGALHSFEKALTYASDSLPVKDDIYFELGITHYRMRNLDPAKKSFEAALHLNDDHADALVYLGNINRMKAGEVSDAHERRARLDEAAAQFLRATNIRNDILDEYSEPVWALLGGIRRRLGQTTEAIEAYTEAIKHKEDSSYAYNNLGLLYMELQDHDKMRATFFMVERLAMAKINTRPTDQWAYNDLLISRLVLDKLPEVKDPLDVICTFGKKEPGQAALDTLDRLKQFKAVSRKGAVEIPRIARRIKDHLATLP